MSSRGGEGMERQREWRPRTVERVGSCSSPAHVAESLAAMVEVVADISAECSHAARGLRRSLSEQLLTVDERAEGRDPELVVGAVDAFLAHARELGLELRRTLEAAFAEASQIASVWEPDTGEGLPSDDEQGLPGSAGA